MTLKKDGLLSSSEIKHRLLYIASASIEILQRENIDVYLAYGSLLGSVRHGGFIPWDDDFDLACKAKDLPRVKSVLKKFLPEDLGFISSEEYDSYRNWVYKVGDTKTTVDNNPESVQLYAFNEIDEKFGLTIDIYPLQSASSIKILRDLLFIFCRLSEKILGPWSFGIKRKLVSLYSWIFSESKYYFTQADFSKVLHKSDFDGVIDSKFENCIFPAPIGSHRILQTLYGNYRMPTREEDRIKWIHYNAVCWKKTVIPRNIDVRVD